MIHLRCWEVLHFLTFQRQRCIKILCPKEPEFYTPLALNRQKGQHLPAPEVYKNQSPKLGWSLTSGRRMSGSGRFQGKSGLKVFALFSLIFQGNSHFNRSLGMYLEVPDILLPDAGDQPISHNSKSCYQGSRNDLTNDSKN